MNNLKKILIMTILVLAFGPVYAKEMGTLKIQARGFSDDKGQAVALVFKKGDKMPTRHSVSVKSKIKNGKAVLQVENLEYGEYAIIVYHDSNSNNEVDHTWYRLPAEQMGFSGGFKIAISSGMPSFEKLKFRFDDEKFPLVVTVN